MGGGGRGQGPGFDKKNREGLDPQVDRAREIRKIIDSRLASLPNSMRRYACRLAPTSARLACRPVIGAALELLARERLCVGF